MTGATTIAARFDPALPRAGVMLDSEAVAPVLGRSFEGGGPLDVRIRYLRYKPRTNLVVHYDVAVNGARHDAVGMVASGASLARRAVKPDNVALARLVAARAPVAEPLAYDEDVGCLVQWYPLDLSLPALATPPADLRLLLEAAGLAVEASDEEPERLAYKPRRRVVLRVDGHVVKMYARDREFWGAMSGQRAASTLLSLSAPRLEAVFPDRLLTVQTFLRGRPVPDAASVAAAAGALLALLHGSRASGLHVFGAEAQLEAARASARLVGAIAPELRPRLHSVLASLAEAIPRDGALAPSHADFNARQLLVCDGGLGITDFDEFCLAAPALDPATYAAYLVYGRPGDLEAALAALDELVSGYGERPTHLSWYLSTMILRRAPRPFRYFEPDWRPRVEQMVAAAVGALGT